MAKIWLAFSFVFILGNSPAEAARCFLFCPTPTPTPSPTPKPSPTPSPSPSPSPSVAPSPTPSSTPTTKTYTIPSSGTGFAECNSSGLNIADCINQLAAKKATLPLETWTLKINSGTFPLKEAILLHNVQNLTIEGASLTNPASTTLIANALPTNRTTLQYFSVIISDSKNVKLRGFKLDGYNLSGTRGIALCSSFGKAISNVTLDSLQMRNYLYFNIIGGNSIATENLSSIISSYATATLPSSKASLKQWANYLASFPSAQLYCGGDTDGLTLSNSTIYMKSVAFYFVPPTQQATYNVQVSQPNTSGSSLPSWYVQAKSYASQFTNIVVTKNQLLNDQTNESLVANSSYHSALKLGASIGIKVTQNNIDARTLPNAYGSGAAINVSSDCYDTLIDGNTIRLPTSSPYKHGIGLPMYYEQHIMYGLGDKMIFGQMTGTRLTNNAFYGAGIRLQDCCIKPSATGFDARPYCQQRDGLLGNGLTDDAIFIGYNSKDGSANRDLQLILRQSGETAWVQYYQNLAASGNGGIYCRQKVGVTYATNNGTIIIPK